MRKTTLLLLALVFGWTLQAQVTDNFDSYTAGDDPTGWTKYQTEADDPGFIVTDSESNSAPNSLYHNDDNIATESTSWIVAPVYTSTGDDMLEFYYRQNYTGSYYIYSGVWYSTTGSDPIANPGDWTQIAEFNDTDQPYSEDTWTLFRHTFNEAAGTQIYVAFKYTGDWAHEFYIDDFKLDVAPAYLPPTFELSLTNVDCTASQFSVNVNVSDLGGSNSVTVSDDQGSATQQVSAPGTVTFGPYTSGTTVNFTVTSDDDNTVMATDNISYTCPTTPGDDCFNAITAMVYPEGGGAGNETAVDGATLSDSGAHPTCDNAGTNLDVWFEVTVPAGQTGFIAIFSGNAATDVESALWDSCGGNELACNAASSDSYVTFNGLTGGQTYYVQLWLDSFNSDTFNVVFEELPQAPDCASNPTPADGATVTVESGRKVVLNWDAPTTGPTPTHYKVEAGTTAGGPYSISVTFDAANVPPLNYTGLADNTTYYWKVIPINNGSEAIGCPEWSFTTQYPAVPANDTCSAPAVLNVDDDTCVSPTLADNSFASDSGEAAPSCANYNGGDLWYQITVPASGHIVIETSEVTGSGLSDTGMAVYSGSCGSLTEIDCNDDGGSGTFSKIELTGQNPGDVLLVRVWEYGNNAFGEFNICAWNPDASSIEDNQIAGFKFYPNPVNNTLTLSAKDTIEKVNVFNIAGQEVLKVAPEATQTQIDMSKLQNGVYFVKAQINGQLTAFKVVKK